ncbi:MAG TPA: bifunctional (p)ppGpp synthetase/guanosine-3',5'-bis(diphosphate) 3'-pyrophosphohydrolase, partial [Candidatus Cloacimonetes bacterium]|nr:bifunctional (p)ppGpp synthetase/guanosine-3',5'-bis(diphosphate) 3'-pyrophosphohydrolase [Candidatus Cloacimonadota bacterium]
MIKEDIDLEKFINEIKSIRDDIDLSLMKKVSLQNAFLFAKNAHQEQMRESGKPYWEHPANVACILASMNMDAPTIIAGLLHDIIEDTKYTYEDISKAFGSEIADLVEGVSKLKKYHYKTHKSRKEQQAENFRKLLISITEDIRIILIKLADRLHNMRTIKYLDQEKIKRISQETLDIYAPLASRFGLAKIKWELEDLSFKYLYPDEYKNINEVISQKKEERDAYIREVVEPLKKYLDEDGIKAEVFGRSKHFYSIYRKKVRKNLDYEDIYDFAAIRIIVEKVEECYEVLGTIQTLFEPIKQRFRDYISRPKPNNYQSLHTVVIGPNARKVEVQIRTKEMNIIAEEGIAAHWHYKELKDSSDKVYQKKLEKTIPEKSYHHQIVWIRKLLQQEKSSDEFMDFMQLNLYPDIIVVQTPDGDFIKLPKHATPIDLAFAVHTDVGFHCIGAKVNGKFVPIRTLLHTGDVVEVLTSPQGHPSKDWLSFMKSSKAKQKIRTYFRHKELDDAIQLGEDIFLKNCRKIHYKFKNEEDILEIARRFKINDFKTFFAQIGKGDILFASIKEIIEEKQVEENPIPEEPVFEELPDGSLERKVARGVKIGGIDNLMIHYAKCCHPVPGDKIIAYTTRGRGITIHRQNCSNPG